MKEKDIAKINIANEATIALQLVNPFLMIQEEAAISELKNIVRAGENTEKDLLMGVSKLIVIEDLRDSLTGKIKTGNKVRKEIEDGRST